MELLWLLQGANKGTLTATGIVSEIPAYFGDNKYTTNVDLETKVEKMQEM